MASVAKQASAREGPTCDSANSPANAEVQEEQLGATAAGSQRCRRARRARRWPGGRAALCEARGLRSCVEPSPQPQGYGSLGLARRPPGGPEGAQDAREGGSERVPPSSRGRYAMGLLSLWTWVHLLPGTLVKVSEENKYECWKLNEHVGKPMKVVERCGKRRQVAGGPREVCGDRRSARKDRIRRILASAYHLR